MSERLINHYLLFSARLAVLVLRVCGFGYLVTIANVSTFDIAELGCRVHKANNDGPP